LTEQGLHANTTLLLGKRIKIHFPGYGSSYGKLEVIEYDAVKDLYKLEFAVDGEVHFMTFKNVLGVVPRSWFAKQASAHQARVIHSLARAAHAACYLGIGIKPIQVAHLLSEKFTEPGHHKMCCKTHDSSKWLKAMIKEIKQLEKTRCWKVDKLSSVPHSAELTSCRWVFKLKYRDGAYKRHRARLITMGYQQETEHDYFESFSPTCSHSTIRLVLALTSGILWILMPCVLSFQATLPKASIFTIKVHPVTILVGNCLSMLKCIYGLVQAPH